MQFVSFADKLRGKHRMIRLSPNQYARIGGNVFRERLQASLARADADFRALPPADQKEFVALAHDHARGLGFRTEQGVAAYALGASWMGIGFEEPVPLLMVLLRAPVPEVRKVHGMSDWVHDQLGPRATPESGDAALRRSFVLTTPWGLR
jgi:hypothetical protein